jgi:hypothetical protein
MARLGLSSRAETNLNLVLEVPRFCFLFLHSLGRLLPSVYGRNRPEMDSQRRSIVIMRLFEIAQRCHGRGISAVGYRRPS